MVQFASFCGGNTNEVPLYPLVFGAALIFFAVVLLRERK